MNNQKEKHAPPSEGTSQPSNKSSKPDANLKPKPYQVAAVKDAKDQPGAAIKSAKAQLGGNWRALTGHTLDREGKE